LRWDAALRAEVASAAHAPGVRNTIQSERQYCKGGQSQNRGAFHRILHYLQR
jgi:hypothetical protein